jgi:hypothetical protein
MNKFVVRMICWAVGTFVLAILPAWLLFSAFYAQRHPRETIAEAYLRQRLGEMTRTQESTVRQAVHRDPLLAMLAVTSAQQSNTSAWQAVANVAVQPPSQTEQVQRLALDAALAGELSQPEAVRFVNSTLALWGILEDASPDDAAQYLAETQRLSPEEYLNAASDPSYAMVVAKLEPRFRGTFQANQRILTPLLAMSPPEQWNELLARFERAQPRVSEILQDPKLGRTFGLVYMLQFEFIKPLVQAGISETEAINFVGINAPVLRGFANDNPDWTPLVLRLRQLRGPHEQPLLRAACEDPAVFWLVTHAAADQREAAFSVLQKYAGTDLPAVLLKYGGDSKLLAAVIDSLIRFDNDGDFDPAKRQAAAMFLNRYQDDDAFKEALARHGSVLIPALSCGGRDALAQIRKNPSDISKWVDANGRPRKTPLWTYIPGGNIVFAVREKVNGRTVTWGELGWAAVDAVLLVPVVGQTAIAARTVMVGERAGGEALVEVAASSAAKESEQIAVEDVAASQIAKAGGQELVVESMLSSAQIGATLEARTLLKAAGAKLVAGFGETMRIMVSFAKSHPLIASAATLGVLLAVFPETGEIGKKIRHVLNDAARGTAKTLGSITAAIPGSAIEGMWDEIQSLIARRPMLAPVYYTLLAVLVLWMVIIPIYLLKRLVRPLYLFIAAPLVALARGLARHVGLAPRQAAKVPTE